MENQEKSPGLVGLIAVAVISAAMLGTFSYAWKVAETMATMTQQLLQVTTSVVELKKDLTDTKNKYDDKFDELERLIHSR